MPGAVGGAPAVAPLAPAERERLDAALRATLARGIHGLCFSPYLEGQQPGSQIGEAQIRERLAIVRPHTRWIRSFSCTDGHEHTPRIAHEMGLKTLVGAWLGTDREINAREIEALIRLAGEGLVDIATVGNEVLLRDELPEPELLDCVRRVRAALPGHVPVGCVDAYFQFVDRPALTQACDVLLPNCYPFWEGADIGHAVAYLRHMHALVRDVAGGKTVIVAETGWPGKGQTVAAAVPSPDNAMRYFVDVQDWARRDGVELFYFSSFDEPWKLRHEGEVGTQWGLWDKDERLKYGTEAS